MSDSGNFTTASLREEDAAFPDMGPELRAQIAAGYASFSERREIWYRLADSPAIELLRQGRMEEARGALEQTLRA
ncbi:hypothetical protein DYH09_23125 [bacterium CPR1]|nr:hypothetical protein [bacterium CPR1]